jgi:IrrE N-terminal-like domain
VRTRVAGGEKRLWFEEGEIERTVEEALIRGGVMPTLDAPVVDIELFVELHLGCLLDRFRELPRDVLGVTEFRRGSAPVISINRELTGSALDDSESPMGTLGRWRATIAHEASHVLLHRSLFIDDENQDQLFAETQPETEQRCLKRDVSYAATSRDWREVQANKAMAALLMPRSLFAQIVRREQCASGLPSVTMQPGTPEAERIVTQVGRLLEVSRQATLIRLGETGFLASPSAAPLF